MEFPFPKKPRLFNKWAKLVGLKTHIVGSEPNPKKPRVCENHFSSDDFEKGPMNLGQKLKEAALPSLNLPTKGIYNSNLSLIFQKFAR